MLNFRIAKGATADESISGHSHRLWSRYRNLGCVWIHHTRKVVDIGPIHASKDKQHNVPYGPVAGAVLALGGVILLVKSKA